MSLFYFKGSELAKDNALNIHNNKEAKPEEELQYIVFSSNSIMLAVAALEAKTNELVAEYRFTGYDFDDDESRNGTAQKYTILPKNWMQRKIL